MSETKARSREVTQVWVDSVKAELKTPTSDHGISSQAALARAVSCSSPTLTYIFALKQSHSKLVGPISDLLNIPVPPVVPITDRQQQILDMLSSLSDKEQDAIIVTLTALADKAKG